MPSGGTLNNYKLLNNEEEYVIVLTTNMADPRGGKSNLLFVDNNTQNVMHKSTSERTRQSTLLMIVGYGTVISQLSGLPSLLRVKFT